MSNERSERIWVEVVGGIIIARLCGTPTAHLIRECQDRVVTLQSETACERVLYDALELDRPAMEIVLTQQALTSAFKQSGAKIAVVVPNTGLAYLARLAFGEADHRVFYNDMAAAILWLAQDRA